MTAERARAVAFGTALVAGALVSAQWAIALVAAAGPWAPWPSRESLTTIGQSIVHPEYDLLAYAAGCGLALGIMGLQLALTARAARSADAAALTRMAWAVGAAAALSAALFLAALDTVMWTAYNRWRLTGWEVALVFAGPAMGWAGCVAAAARAGRPLGLRVPLGARYGFDGCVIGVLFACIAVGPGSGLAARIYVHEGLFHWNFFAVGPALQYAHGMALGTEAYSVYGVGFPALLGAAYRVSPWGYDDVLTGMTAYLALYFAGLYGLLVWATRSRGLAAGGVAAALALTLFAPSWEALGLATGLQWPSSSPLRSPADVWFFLAAYGYLRRRSALRAGLMGGATGLGLVLETDTGVGLCALLGVLLVYGLWMDRGQAAFWSGLAAFAGVTAAGLGWASRGTLFTSPLAFFLGWLEAPLNFAGGGEGSLVLLSRSTWAHLALFGAMTAAALAATGWAMRTAYLRREAPATMLLGAAGLFALFRLTVFVQRSTPTNLWHGGVAVAVVAALALGLILAHPAAPAAWRRYVPTAFAVFAAAAVWVSPSFRTYPSLARSLTGSTAEGDVCFPGAFCGLPASHEAEAAAFASVTAYLRDAAGSGATLGVLDHHAPMYQTAANVPIWGRDTVSFFNLLTIASREAYIASLLATGPDRILIRETSPNVFFTDTWAAVRAALPTAYDRESSVGGFEVWRRR